MMMKRVVPDHHEGSATSIWTEFGWKGMMKDDEGRRQSRHQNSQSIIQQSTSQHFTFIFSFSSLAAFYMAQS